MLNYRTKRLADQRARAVKRLTEIEASIRILSDDDLLDFADIFKDGAVTPLSELASAEMMRRSISL